MRIAILGGSFDPIHKGHLQIAITAKKRLGVDEVWFMPALLTPLKDVQSASYTDRCEMIARAIQPYRYMRLSTLEGEWDDRSYTIRSVEELLKRYPQHEFCWLIGDDQAQHFDAWKDSEKLLSLITFYVFSRDENMVLLPEGLHRVTMDFIRVSSSAIRRGECSYLVPRVVMEYMGKHGLYVEDRVRSRMSEARYQHSVSVAQLCVRLAQAHHLDTRIAYCMGMTHDICKEMPKDKAMIWMRRHMPSHVQVAPAIWHGYIGASYVSQHLYMYDKRIREAIFHHVTGRNKTDYDRILFIADKLDPKRGYDSRYEIEVSMRDLKKGFALVQQQQVQYLKKEGTL